MEEIIKHNIENKTLHKDCKDHELDEIKVIFQRCKKCGKWVPVPDPELIKRRGVSGRG